MTAAQVRESLDPEVAALLPEARAVINRVARSFSLAARLLPRKVRNDVDLLYYVLRTIDDLIDVEVARGDVSREGAVVRLAAIEAWARSGNSADAPYSASGAQATPPSIEIRILHDLARRHPNFPRDAIGDFSAGMRDDLAGPTMTTDDDLARYCYRVAGTVGRMMAALLGVKPGAERAADAAARALGSAMQRTNILRDIDEDLARGRIYLPATALRAAHINPAASAGAGSLLDSDRRALLRELIARADAEYDEGLAGIRYLAHGGRSIRAAALLYREILRQVERDGLGSRRPHRPVVGRARKVLLLARAVIGR
jgi:phytoene synthase